jgi:hypothetical protein
MCQEGEPSGVDATMPPSGIGERWLVKAPLHPLSSHGPVGPAAGQRLSRRLRRMRLAECHIT